jgi:predicted nucleic acid-binding protein
MNIVSSNIINSIKVEQVQFDEIRKIEGSQMIATDYPAYLVDESKLTNKF